MVVDVSAKIDPLCCGSQIVPGTAKPESIWKQRAIDAVLVSVAAISLTALAVRLFGR